MTLLLSFSLSLSLSLSLTLSDYGQMRLFLLLAPEVPPLALFSLSLALSVVVYLFTLFLSIALSRSLSRSLHCSISHSLPRSFCLALYRHLSLVLSSSRSQPRSLFVIITMIMYNCFVCLLHTILFT